MSDYVHTKSVMYPVTEELLKKMKLKDVYDLEEKLPKTDLGTFDIEGLVDYASDYECRYYVSLEFYSNYGDDAADFGRSRFLTKKEQEKYVPIFSKIIPELDSSKLKYVEFCYYNCCNCQDYYITEDEFYKEI